LAIDLQTSNPIKPDAKTILKDGKLLETTESLALAMSNNYDFARRIVKQVSLIFAGQAIKHLNIGQLDRAYSHLGVYAPPGLGKDYAWKLVHESGIFPTSLFRLTKLENVTEAALSGTIAENTIVPPPTITEDIIFFGEYATLMRPSVAASISADLRAILESGTYSRRMAKVGLLKETIETQPNSLHAKYILSQQEKYSTMGMTVDLEKCGINVKSTTSLIVSSARFGSETNYGHSLLSMGDINRYRWLSYLPDQSERLEITSKIGSLPPVIVDVDEKKACLEAWNTLVPNLRKLSADGLLVPRDEQSFYERQKVWDDTQRAMMDTYKSRIQDVHFDQLVNLRTRAEFTRIMYQHAALKQFQRDQGHDFSEPQKFIVDYKEDGEFAQQIWLGEYVPSMIDVIDDVLRGSRQTMISSTSTLTSKGVIAVIEILKNSPAKRATLIDELKKIGVSQYLLDNKILPFLLKQKLIVRNKFGQYSLLGDETTGQTILTDKSEKPKE
jgi:hypothetical protein